MPANSPNPVEETKKIVEMAVGEHAMDSGITKMGAHLLLDFSRFPLGGQELKNTSPLQQDGYSGKGRGMWWDLEVVEEEPAIEAFVWAWAR
jgi:hypothetical protein